MSTCTYSCFYLVVVVVVVVAVVVVLLLLFLLVVVVGTNYAENPTKKLSNVASGTLEKE